MRYDVIDGELVPMVEICTKCGRAPQSPAWGQCFGCGQVNTERKFVPSKECAWTGITFPTGIRHKTFQGVGPK